MRSRSLAAFVASRSFLLLGFALVSHAAVAQDVSPAVSAPATKADDPKTAAIRKYLTACYAEGDDGMARLDMSIFTRYDAKDVVYRDRAGHKVNPTVGRDVMK